MRKFIAIKEKVYLYFNQITFNYNQKGRPLHLQDTRYKQLPQKKNVRKKKNEGKGKKRAEEGDKKGRKRKGKSRGRRQRGMRRKEKSIRRKGDGKSLCGRKGKRKKELKKKKEQKMKRTAQGMHRSLRTHSLARS